MTKPHHHCWMLWGLLGLALSHLTGAQPPTPQPTAPPATAEPRWRWRDFEIVGSTQTDPAAIRQAIPLPLGGAFPDDPEVWAAWCPGLAERFGLASLSCSPVLFLDGRAYLVVEVVEKEEAERLQFGTAPLEDVALPESLVSLYTRLRERQQDNFRQGRANQEDVKQGYLDYSEPVMHGIAQELAAAVPPHRTTLLAALAQDKDAEDRARAATLLHWAPDKEGSIAAAHRYLADPSSLVRNDISRFLLFYLDQVKSRETLGSVIDALALQLSRPSHGDRNKALYALESLLEGTPDLSPVVAQKAGPWILRIARQSVLDNVGGVAKGLAERLKLETEVPTARRDGPPSR
ncbi:MAG TPA: hypothetical protein VF017_18955 [Thermoanaerobaculia bacterium]|nr:hypothetical protein [Thermoanaerobaculia bacterium]